MENKGMDRPGYGQQQQQQWNPTPLQYGQQPGYGQQQHHQQQPQGQFVVPIQQPIAIADYSFPQGTAPAVLLTLVAFANFLYFVVYGALSGIWFLDYFLVPLIFHAVSGGLGFGGSCNAQRSVGLAVVCIIFACISTGVAFWRVIVGAVAIGLSTIEIMWPFLIHVLMEVVAIFCSIALIVLPSKVVCCRSQQASGGVVVYTGQQNPGYRS